MSEHKPNLLDPYPFLFSKARKLDEEVDSLRASEKAYLTEIRRLRRLFLMLKHFNDGRQHTHAHSRNYYTYRYNEDQNVLDCEVNRRGRRSYYMKPCCPDVNEMRQYALDALSVKPNFLSEDEP